MTPVRYRTRLLLALSALLLGTSTGMTMQNSGAAPESAAVPAPSGLAAHVALGARFMAEWERAGNLRAVPEALLHETFLRECVMLLNFLDEDVCEGVSRDERREHAWSYLNITRINFDHVFSDDRFNAYLEDPDVPAPDYAATIAAMVPEAREALVGELAGRAGTAEDFLRRQPAFRRVEATMLEHQQSHPHYETESYQRRRTLVHRMGNANFPPTRTRCPEVDTLPAEAVCAVAVHFFLFVVTIDLDGAIRVLHVEPVAQ